MKKNTLSILTLSALLLFTSHYLISCKTAKEPEARKSRNAWQELTSSQDISNPVFTPDMKGKTIVVNVWATWCSPCRNEIPELNKLVGDYKSDKIVFIALDGEDSTAEKRKMRQENIRFDY